MRRQSFWVWLFRRFRFAPILLGPIPLATYVPNLKSLSAPDPRLVQKQLPSASTCCLRVFALALRIHVLTL